MMKINIKYDKKAEELLSEGLRNQPLQKPIWKELGIPSLDSLNKIYGGIQNE